MVKHDKNKGWERYDKFKRNEILEFIKTAKKVVNSMRSPTKRERPGGRTFAMRHQVVALLLRELLGEDFRGIQGFLETCKEAREAIGFDKVPHHTTLQQFSNEISEEYLKEVLERFQDEETEIDLAADATGFSKSDGSYYYTQKVDKQVKISEHIKLHALEDITNQLILAVEVTNGKKHESPFFEKMLKRLPTCLEVGFITADKAYDSKNNHKTIQTRFKAKSAIKINLKGANKPQGINERRKTWEKFQKGERNKEYGKRSLIESAFSAVKRVFGWSLKAIKTTMQVKEIFLKTIAYNIRRTALLNTTV